MCTHWPVYNYRDMSRSYNTFLNVYMCISNRGVKHAAQGPDAAHKLIESGPGGNF